MGLCTSILLVTGGRIETLAGVYTLSFLSVMALFAVGNMLLKRMRASLPRTERASWPAATVALGAVLIGILGNILLDPLNVEVFVVYFSFAVMAVGLMFLRVPMAVKGKFGLELIERLSRRLGIEKNYMFIGTPSDRFPHRIEDLGGVRVIL